MKMENECNKWKYDRVYNYLRRIADNLKNNIYFLRI